MEATVPSNIKFTASSFLSSDDANELNPATTLKQVHPYLGLNFSKFNFGHLMKPESSIDKLSNFACHLNTSYNSTRPVMFSDSLTLTPYVPHRKRRENKPRRQRTTFSSEQTLKLEMEYRRAEYVTRTRRLELADDLDLTETQIKIWYQNRRAKDKRIEKAHIDQHIRSMGFNNLPTPLQYSGLPPLTLPSMYGWDPWMLRTPLNNVNKV